MTTRKKINKVFESQRASFSASERGYKNRMELLSRLYTSVKDYEDEILDALHSDLGKSREEAYITEIGYVLSEISHIMKRLKSWMRSRRVKNSIFIPFSSSSYFYEPYGQVLIISPWNYPFSLAFSPLVGAIAAGNTCIIKPSEVSEKTSSVIKRLISENFSEDDIAVVEGGSAEAKTLLSLPFDNIFFTGSPIIGKKIMKASADKLIPTTLELGGKSPCYVSRNADIDLAVERIVFGKFINAGQTCIAPDYVLVDETVSDKLIERIKSHIESSYAKMGVMGKIINEKHLSRLAFMLKGQEVYYGGEVSKNKLNMSPTLVVDPPLDSKLMTEEIFGPILPIVTVESVDNAINIMEKIPKPLASYIFSDDKKEQKRFLSCISAGGSCINDTILHISNAYLPFGGVGNSGIGRYRGWYSFENFSNVHSVYSSSKIKIPRLPPYGKNLISILKRVLR